MKSNVIVCAMCAFREYAKHTDPVKNMMASGVCVCVVSDVRDRGHRRDRQPIFS